VFRRRIMENTNIDIFNNIINILSMLLTATSAIYKFIEKKRGINNQSLENTKKRFEIYDKIITNVNNEVLSYTYLKDYVGCPISNVMVKYILKSPFFYDFITIWKNIYSFVTYDPETQKIKYEDDKKPGTKIYAILYFIFLLPFLVFLYLVTKPLPCEYLIALFLIAVSFAIVGIFFFLFEYGNRVLAIKLMEKLERDETSTGS
jgi:hypothetical protein